MHELTGRNWRLLIGDVRDRLRDLPDNFAHCAVTSPPYWALRDYGKVGQIGLETTPEEYTETLVAVFREVRRVLRNDATLWLNLGDTYNAYNGNRGASTSLQSATEHSVPKLPGGSGLTCKSLKPKDLVGIPWRVAFALQADGWILRSEIIWAKKSPMPEPVRDRPTKAHEQIFLFSKRPRYFYDAEAIREPGSGRAPGNKTAGKFEGVEGHRTKQRKHLIEPATSRNAWSVWSLATEAYRGAHFATYPSEIPIRAIKSGTSAAGACPHCGAPWVRIVERESVTRERKHHVTKRSGSNGTGNHCPNTVAGIRTSTAGWVASCNCPHDAEDIVPCNVLEPFAGSGTTIRAALDLGRRAVGIELNPEYAELARVRITAKGTGNLQQGLPGQRQLFDVADYEPTSEEE